MADISAPVSASAGNLTLSFKNSSMGASKEWENEATTPWGTKKKLLLTLNE